MALGTGRVTGNSGPLGAQASRLASRLHWVRKADYEHEYEHEHEKQRSGFPFESLARLRFFVLVLVLVLVIGLSGGSQTLE